MNSRLYGIDKGVVQTKIRIDVLFRQQADVFNRDGATKDKIILAREGSFLCVYNGRSDYLDSLRYTRFCQKVATGTSFVQPESLPPTSAAAAFHSQRVYFQVQQWEGVSLNAVEWGWKLTDEKLLPIPTVGVCQMQL